MAARTRRVSHNDKTREKIQTSQIVNRLTKHVLGEVEMSASQVSAALGLLRKSLPDIQAIEMNVNAEVRQRVINAQPLTDDDWEKRYGDSLESAAGTTGSTH